MKRNNEDIIFEESLSDEWEKDLEVVEVPLDDRPLFSLGVIMSLIVAIVAGRVLYLGVARGTFYEAKAEDNLTQGERIPAPRGLITDRFGEPLVTNRPVFSAFLDLREFLRRSDLQEHTLDAIERVLQIPRAEVWRFIGERDLERAPHPVVLRIDLAQSQLIALRELDLPTLAVKSNFKREYPEGPIFSSVVGYIGLTTKEDLEADPLLTGEDFVGKAGIEAFYDAALQGEHGANVTYRDAHGNVLNEQKKSDPKVGAEVRLTIDGEFQSYFYKRFSEGLASLGRTSGVGLALNPRNGEVLALMSFPAFDNNVFSAPERSAERQEVLTSSRRPLFNRAIAGRYTPGSTIKPLVAAAALTEDVVTAEKTIFSPGYLDVPNPFDPEKPTRFLDWRYQGDVNLVSAIAQSSNVYFYTVGGGTQGFKGLGINRLHEWWEKFGLGKLTGIDLPGEEEGFLPTIEWKEARDGRPWLVGDTYNVSIGQGDLLVTPLQLLSYIGAIGNGGKVYRPVVNAASETRLNENLSTLEAEIGEVQRGMRQAVRSPSGTAHLLSDLPFSIGAKTGTAQVLSGEQENAFFVGYAPAEDPEVAILVLVENSREGSLNAVPIAKDVLNWYYVNRIRK